MSKSKTALVLGATGGVGGTVATTLLRYGWTVRALARDPAKAASAWKHRTICPEWIAGDALKEADVVKAASGVEIIVHAVNPPGYRNWDKVVLPMMANTIAAARAAGGARILLPGTIYNFDPKRTPVIDAASPQTPRNSKGAVRVQLEKMLEDAAPDVPSLIVRAGDFFGPETGASWFTQCLVTPGKPIRRLLNPAKGAGHSWAYLPDLAEAMVRLLEASDRLAPFERVQFEGYHDVTGTGLIDALRHVVGKNVPVRAFPWWLMRLAAPFGGFPREVVEIEPFWRHPRRLDNARLVALIGAEPRTPLDGAVASTLAGLGCIETPLLPQAAQPA